MFVLHPALAPTKMLFWFFPFSRLVHGREKQRRERQQIGFDWFRVDFFLCEKDNILSSDKTKKNRRKNRKNRHQTVDEEHCWTEKKRWVDCFWIMKCGVVGDALTVSWCANFSCVGGHLARLGMLFVSNRARSQDKTHIPLVMRRHFRHVLFFCCPIVLRFLSIISGYAGYLFLKIYQSRTVCSHRLWFDDDFNTNSQHVYTITPIKSKKRELKIER